MAQPTYDVVVIGSGPGGYVAAVRAAHIGLKTAIVEKDPFFGGTCLWRGCIPTKALLENAAVYEQARHLKQFGISAGEVVLDLGAVMQRKTVVVRKLGKGVEGLIKRNKIDSYQGHGRLAGRGRVAVTGADGKVTEIQTKNVLVATGSAPKSLPGLTIDGKTVVTSDEILEVTQIPKKLIVLGAGAVGVEFASIFHRFGAAVTIVEMLPRVVPIEDEEISAELARVFGKQGIGIRTGVLASNIRVETGGVKLDVAPAPVAATAVGTPNGPVRPNASGQSETLEADLLLVAVGRRPLTHDVGLAGTSVVLDKGFIQVDGYMRTAEPGVYAIGDVVNTPLLAHVASAEGILAIEHMAGREVRPINYDHVPSATYCEPEVASIGLTEARAKQKGYDVKVGKFAFSHSSKAPILGATDGFVKMVAEARYGELLGVHIIGPRATEMIAEAGVALKTEATVEEIYRTIHPHPTLSEAMGEAAWSVFGHAIHS
ncbi:MAG TPA: dihydrolipoyl dehydrogenase [Candidatus Polarisedimenticolia bacterium]|nr:dihydrolipoyl dehydrogenase [Candidatus Polarisedimenticolia bacterium]